MVCCLARRSAARAGWLSRSVWRGGLRKARAAWGDRRRRVSCSFLLRARLHHGSLGDTADADGIDGEVVRDALVEVIHRQRRDVAELVVAIQLARGNAEAHDVAPRTQHPRPTDR